LHGELQDRNPGEIDRLAPRKLEQEVERPLEAAEIDDESRIALAAVELGHVLIEKVCVHLSSAALRINT